MGTCVCMRTTELCTTHQLLATLLQVIRVMAQAGWGGFARGQLLAGMSSITVCLSVVFAVVSAVVLDAAEIIGGRRAARRTRARLEQGMVVLLLVGWSLSWVLTRLIQ